MPLTQPCTHINATDSKLYWERFLFDMTFWLLISFLFVQLVMGLIVSTYIELRSQKKKEHQTQYGKCIICGLCQEDFETRTLDWEQHIKEEHNLNNYINYIIYIKSKNIEECDGVEKYVKKCISNKQTSFFPKRDTVSFQKPSS